MKTLPLLQNVDFNEKDADNGIDILSNLQTPVYKFEEDLDPNILKQSGEKDLSGKPCWHTLAFKESDPEKKIQFYSQHIKEQPKDREGYFYRAEEFLRFGEYQKANNDVNQLIDLEQKENETRPPILKSD